MRPRDEHPGTPPSDDGRNPDSPRASANLRRRRRKPAPPLWQPDDQVRDVNLEMTPDDLDRNSAGRRDARRYPPPRVTPVRAREGAESSDFPGLSRFWRDQILP